MDHNSKCKSKEIRFRRLKKSDVPQIQDVALKSWKYAYRTVYTPKNIRKFVSRYYSNDSFANLVFPAIRKNQSCFHVALDGNRVIGYSQVAKTKLGWELLRIYLLPRYIGRGIGKKLLHHTERFLKQNHAKAYFAYAHMGNRISLQFYRGSGFVRKKARDQSPTSYCFVKELRH